MRRWLQTLEAPVHPASLAFFRIAYALILLWEMLRFFHEGWITDYYVEPSFHFHYRGFEWLHPWPAPWIHVHFVGLGLCCVGLALGWRTRWCALLFTLGFGMVFLLEKARYLNHFYLVLLLGGLLVLLPSGNAFSLDARRLGRARPVPRWSIELLRFQVGLVYLYAALAKLNVDWLQGEPMRAWLSERSDGAVFGPALGHPLAPWFFSYGGLLLDLLAWPMLACSRTRRWFFPLVVFFHLANSRLFGIGIFPALMLAATTIFFAPDWPRRWVPGMRTMPTPARGPRSRGESIVARTWRPVVLVWVLVQVLVPLRHFLYPGSVHWTEEGHCFSWHMKLRSKKGQAIFRIVDRATGEVRFHDPRGVLTDWQHSKMAGRPDMVLEYAQHLAAQAAREGRDVAVHAEVEVSLNGRRPQRLVDPEVDLGRVRASWRPSSWITDHRPGWRRDEEDAPSR